jgi:CheY-like chemotaxis protein
MYMPQMTGRLLLYHLLSRGMSDIPVILMTASPGAAEEFADNTSVDYLAKPFDIDELLSCVSRYIRPPTANGSH